MKPNPEAFAKTVLAELARLHGEAIATRFRVYQLMEWMRFPQAQLQMELQDDKSIESFQKHFSELNMTRCGLAPGPTPPDVQPPTA